MKHLFNTITYTQQLSISTHPWFMYLHFVSGVLENLKTSLHFCRLLWISKNKVIPENGGGVEQIPQEQGTVKGEVKENGILKWEGRDGVEHRRGGCDHETTRRAVGVESSGVVQREGEMEGTLKGKEEWSGDKMENKNNKGTFWVRTSSHLIN